MTLALSMTVCWAGDVPSDAEAQSVVVADRKSGRLVRRVLVAERIVRPRVVSFRPVSGGAATGKQVALGTEQVSVLVNEMAGKYEVDPLLVHAVIHVESAYDRFAVSRKGAEGLMQLIPATARRLGVRNSFDTRENIEGGVRYLRMLQDRFSDLRHVLAAYNAGEEAVSRYRGIPPYAETHDYIFKVGRRYGELRREHRRIEQVAVAAPPPEPEHRPLEVFIDPEGRLHLKTR